MPKVKDISYKLIGTQNFSTLDLQAGYYHIPLDDNSIPETAFTSPFRKYGYLKVPFGTGTSASVLLGTHKESIEGPSFYHYLPQ